MPPSKPLLADDLEKGFQALSSKELEAGFQKDQQRGGIFSSPKGFFGPGIVANLDSRMRGISPDQSYAEGQKTLGNVGALAASVAIKSPTPFLGRMALQGGIQGGAAALTGESPSESLKQGGLGALFQGGTEALLTPLKWALNSKVAARAIAKHAADSRTAQESYKAKKAFDEAFSSALEQLDKTGYKQQVQAIRDKYAEALRQSRIDYKAGKQKTMQGYEQKVAAQETGHAAAVASHSEQAAAKIMDAWKGKVSSWKDYPSTTEGLVDAVVGKGQDDVSKMFDTAMKNVVTKAKGEKIILPAKDAAALGLRATDVPADPKTGAGMVQMAYADAADTIQAITGKWSTDKGLYRRVTNVLASKGLGIDPVAKEEYKAAMGLIDEVDKTKALIRQGGKNVLDTEKLMEGLLRVKTVNPLRNRDLGDALRGPIVEAAGGGPLAPSPIPKPVVPPYAPPPKPAMPPAPRPRTISSQPPPAELPPPDITTRKMPLSGHPWMMGAAAEGASHAAGLGSGYMLPFLGGAALSEALPKQIVTKAPLSSEQQRLFQFLPSLLAALQQGAANQYGGMKPAPPDLP